MEKKEVKPSSYPSISDESFALEIRTERKILERSCHWLQSLADQLESFPHFLDETLDQLRKLETRARRGEINIKGRRSMYRNLKHLRTISRNFASEAEPLSCMDVVESVAGFEDYSRDLENLIIDLKKRRM